MAAVGGVAVDADWVGFGALTARRMLLRHARLGTNMPNHDPTDRRIGYVCLLATALGWGLNWPAMKVILRDWPPLLSRGVAGVIAAVLLAMVAVRRSESLRVPYRAVPRLLLAAFTNVFAWMGFTTLSMRWLSVAKERFSSIRCRSGRHFSPGRCLEPGLPLVVSPVFCSGSRVSVFFWVGEVSRSAPRS